MDSFRVPTVVPMRLTGFLEKGERLMTISPEMPNLTDGAIETTRILAEPHLTFVEIGFGYSLMVLIDKGFETDGASVPRHLLNDDNYGNYLQKLILRKYPNITTRWDLENMWDHIVGDPWDMPRLLAAIVHDALYGAKWKLRWLCDIIYRKILMQNSYNIVREEIEYSAIRLVGWRNWNAVSDLERDTTRRLVKIEFLRTKKIPERIKELRG